MNKKSSQTTSVNFNRGILYIALSILAYGTMPILIRTLNAGRVPPMSQVALRYIFAFMAAVIYSFWRKVSLKIDKNAWWILVPISIFGYGFSNLAYTYANLNTEVSNAIFIFFTFSIITPILAYILLKERVNQFNVVGLIFGFVGLGFLFRPNPAVDEEPIFNFLTPKWDWEKIVPKAKQWFVINSDNDPYIPLVDSQELAKNLHQELILRKGEGHFSATSNPKYTQFPYLLDIFDQLEKHEQ